MRRAGGHLTDADHHLGSQDFGLSALKLAIRFGKLLGEGPRFFADLRVSQCEAPAAGECNEFLGLRAEPLRFTRGRAPDDAADAGAVGFEGDPEAVIAGESRGDRLEEPFKLWSRGHDRSISRILGDGASG